jgi:hypothetical protein
MAHQARRLVQRQQDVVFEQDHLVLIQLHRRDFFNQYLDGAAAVRPIVGQE